MSEFTATFLGVRGGYPVPGPSTLEFGGNTTCLEVRVGPHLIIIDAGTGIIGLGDRLIAQRARDHQPIVGTLLFTHGHHDHTQGLRFFSPLHVRDSIFHVFGPRVFEEDLSDMIGRLMRPPTFPIAQRGMPGLCSIRNVFGDQAILVAEPGERPVVVDMDSLPASGVPGMVQIWVYHSSNHPKGGSICYRIEYQGKRFVFATDTEGYIGGDTLLSRFVQGVDVLVHDAEYTEQEYTGPPSRHQGWGHSTWKMAVEVGKRARVKRLILTHHNAKHDDAFMRDLEKKVQSVFPAAIMAREGMTIEL
jgi:phosphoribosyl 1,2-cyclic phosphodiesterase